MPIDPFDRNLRTILTRILKRVNWIVLPVNYKALNTAPGATPYRIARIDVIDERS